MTARAALERAVQPKPSPSGPKPRKLPIRTCVACRTERPKRDLVRIVRTAEGEVKLDATGRASGRGAYLCPNVECLKTAVKRKALHRALGTEPPPECLAALEVEMAAFKPSLESSGPAQTD
ncbi:MAG: YlxR family protein [Armatimonadetes bacterium]|nr:YlxR family protein [Armatimonadota bacterium]